MKRKFMFLRWENEQLQGRARAGLKNQIMQRFIQLLHTHLCLHAVIKKCSCEAQIVWFKPFVCHSFLLVLIVLKPAGLKGEELLYMQSWHSCTRPARPRRYSLNSECYCCVILLSWHDKDSSYVQIYKHIISLTCMTRLLQISPRLCASTTLYWRDFFKRY